MPSEIKAREVRARNKALPSVVTGGSGSTAPMEPSTVTRLIGNEIRRVRKSLGLTGSELGAAAGISAGILSRIENASVSPSAATVKSLAKALNIPISQLLGEDRERADCSFVKAGFGVRIERRGPKSGHRYDLLGHSLGGKIVVKPFLVTLSQNVPCEHFPYAGVEFIYMLSGARPLCLLPRSRRFFAP
jgi:transcriptional regulator with XRE-family HTH domain